MRYQTVIFDFDGTLADSAEAALESLNALAPEFGFAPVSREESVTLRSRSARDLLQNRLGIAIWRVWEIRTLEKRGREEFNARAGSVKAFPGIPEALRQIRASELRIGIVSSNAPSIVEAFLERERIEVDFVSGGSALLGKARALRGVMRAENIARATAVYVGDELRDVEACRKAGLAIIAVGWGLNTAESLRKSGADVVSTPEELVKQLTAYENSKGPI